MFRLRIAAVAVFVLATGGAVLLWWQNFDATPPPVEAASLQRSISATELPVTTDIAADIDRPSVAPPPSATPSTQTGLPPVDTPLHVSLPELLAAAEAGDPKAACRLATQSAFCHFQGRAEALALMYQSAITQNTQRNTIQAGLIALAERHDEHMLRAAAFCPVDSDTLASPAQWWEAAAQRGDLRSAALLALYNPATRSLVRAVEYGTPLSVLISERSVDPSDYLIDHIDDLLRRGRLAGDPLALEASILRYAPDAGLSSLGGEFPLRRANALAFATAVGSWQQLFPDRRLDADLIRAYERDLKLLSDLERRRIDAEVEQEVTGWPGRLAPPDAAFSLDNALKACEPS
jgi:hypothetical protein